MLFLLLPIMRIVAFALACLTCAGYGRRTHHRNFFEEYGAAREVGKVSAAMQEKPSRLNAFAQMLLASPSAGRSTRLKIHPRPLKRLATHMAEAAADVVEKEEKYDEERPWKYYRYDAKPGREGPDPLDPSGESEFVQWFRYQKDLQLFKDENKEAAKKNFWKDLGARALRLARIVAVVLGGFYLIPTLKGLYDAVQTGDLAGSLSASLEDPSGTVNKLVDDIPRLPSSKGADLPSSGVDLASSAADTK